MIPRKLSCEDVRDIIKRFFKGDTMSALSRDYGIGFATVSNIIYRVTYKDCYNLHDDFPNEAVYYAAVEDRMVSNFKLSRGRGKVGAKQ